MNIRNTNRLNPSDRLNPGEAIRSENRDLVLVMQEDGNLVIYAPGNRAIWAAPDRGYIRGSVAIMQEDGNLVIYAPGHRAVWSAPDRGYVRRSVLRLQDDGNLVIYAPGHRAIWATNTVVPPSPNHDGTTFEQRGNMEFSVKVSRTGVVETERYAGIKKQSGTYIHDFWFSVLDENEDTVWAMTAPLTLTIGAATNALGRPSFVSKRERAVFNIPADAARQVGRVALYMHQRRSGAGSLIEQALEAAEMAEDVYKELKDNEAIRDAIAVYTTTPA
jgi:hypothetical protein